MPSNTQLQNVGGSDGNLMDLWITSLPLYHLSHANHVLLRDC